MRPHPATIVQLKPAHPATVAPPRVVQPSSTLRQRGGGDKKEPEKNEKKQEVVSKVSGPPDDSDAKWQNNPCNFGSILTGQHGGPVSLGTFVGWPGKSVPVGATLYHGGSSSFSLSALEDDKRVYFTTCKARADALGNTMQFTVTKAIDVVRTGGHGGDHVDDRYLGLIGAYYSSKECEVVMMGNIAKASLSAGSSCFLTSACAIARGLPDDCFELTVLRGFRDGWLRDQPDGPALIAEYEAIAPAIVDRIHARPDAGAVFGRLYERIEAAVGLVVRGEHVRALSAYRAMVLDHPGRPGNANLEPHVGARAARVPRRRRRR